MLSPTFWPLATPGGYSPRMANLKTDLPSSYLPKLSLFPSAPGYPKATLASLGLPLGHPLWLPLQLTQPKDYLKVFLLLLILLLLLPTTNYYNAAPQG